jgi:hypothetical protein
LKVTTFRIIGVLGEARITPADGMGTMCNTSSIRHRSAPDLHLTVHLAVVCKSCAEHRKIKGGRREAIAFSKPIFSKLPVNSQNFRVETGCILNNPVLERPLKGGS